MSGDDLADRLDALERTVVGDGTVNSSADGTVNSAGDGTVNSAGDGTGNSSADGTDDTADASSRGVPTRSGDVLRLERRVADLEATVEELEAGVQAVRGYAGNVRAVNRDVERRASAALAKAEALETAVGSAPADTAGRPRESGTTPSHHEGDLSREPTVIADSVPDTADDTGSDDVDTADDTSSDADATANADERADRNSDGTDTDQFVERVRDAL
jgi:hypothetical protein